ncbi:hypothetical protein CEXT_561801 [Caerostris extrusa]|uniref:Uncharacterized protein n=1 Tax=Caerostris extrusa TaxID=172846 RepID=A0AAV4W1E2_CAEEX|nr:hypothetical protein CEXT_561801 [Caerostris extrusa]
MPIGGAIQIPIVRRGTESDSLLKREASVVSRVLINQFAAPRLRIGTGVVANYFSESTLYKSAECFPHKSRELINQFAAPRLRIGTGVIANYFSESTLYKSAECFPIKGLSTGLLLEAYWQIPIVVGEQRGCD